VHVEKKAGDGNPHLRCRVVGKRAILEIENRKKYVGEFRIL
jgi:hypothetical protein